MLVGQVRERIAEFRALARVAPQHVDRLNVGVLTCPDLIAEPHELADGLHGALRELRTTEVLRSAGPDRDLPSPSARRGYR